MPIVADIVSDSHEIQKMKETRKLKKINLHDAEVVEKINGEETDKKRVMQRKKKEKVSNVDSSEHPQATVQDILSEKPNRKKVELKKKMQKSTNIAEENNRSPADGKLIEKMQKQRKVKGDNIEINEHSQVTPKAISNKKIKGKKEKLNKTKNKRKANEISSGPVDDEDNHLIKADNNKASSEAVNADVANSGTEIRNRNSKKSNKKKKMKLTSTKENKSSLEKMNKVEEEDVYQISSGDEDCSRGMKKWVTDYYESRPGLDNLQKKIDEFMTAHEERLEQEKQDREAKAAEGGWTVVVHHKGRKKTTDAESGTTVGSVSQAALEDKVAKKKQSEIVGHGFYRFQRRDAQRSELLALQSKFEEDKKRIQQLRAARKFKPY